ncbi:hypothetical protein B0H14DRAFT_3896349 [Mycena olivaceomarginata]|nr:hypothetical protein B0H14DRAFT_3896349 [Mycena olivaceomarginata]
MWSGITQIRYTDVQQPTVLAGSVILDNVKFTGISTANIQDSAGTVVAANAANVPQWFQGNRSSKRYLRGAYTPSGSRPNALIDGSRAFFSRSRPQYETYKDIQFFSIMAIGLGAKGDGVSDDTIAINTFLSKRGKNTQALLALAAVCGSLSKPHQPHPTSTAAIGAANEGVAPHETRAELCHVVRRILSPLCRSSALSYHGGRWGASPRVVDWAQSTIMEPAGGVGGIARWGNRPRRGGRRHGQQ